MGAEISLEVQGRRTRGQQWDTYQVPGPAWGKDWDIKTRKTGSLSSRRNQSVHVCMCACVCVKCVYMFCMCVCMCVKCMCCVSLYCACVCV